MTAGSAEAGAEGAQEPQQSAAAGASQDGQWQATARVAAPFVSRMVAEAL